MDSSGEAVGLTYIPSGRGEMSKLRSYAGVLEGNAGMYRYLGKGEPTQPRLKLRSADEGSTIFYTVRKATCAFDRRANALESARLASTGGGLTTRAGPRTIFWSDYTYTPTVQKRATTPNPPSTLARDAAVISSGTFFGILP